MRTLRSIKSRSTLRVGNTATTLPNSARRARKGRPSSRRLSLCSWTTAPMRAFLPLFAVLAVALLSAEAAWGQGVEHYTKVANQLMGLLKAGDYAGIQT